MNTNLFGTPAHVARAKQAALAAAKVLWLDIDAVNRHDSRDDTLIRKHEKAVLLPIRGAVPYFNTRDVAASYGPNQTAAAADLADSFAGIYWLVCRRRLELERPADVMADNGPDWGLVREAYAERLNWYSVLSVTGMTVLTAMRVHDRLQRRGGDAALDELALEASKRGFEPHFTQPKGRVRIERVGPVRVGGHPPPPARDYLIARRVVPQIGRQPAEQAKILQEI